MSELIREIQQSEYPFLEEMLYQAIFIPEGHKKLPREIIFRTELSKYFMDFGKENDYCLVAERNGELIGAIWIRLFKEDEAGYGYVDDDTPELCMAVKEEHRNKGLGGVLFHSMMKYLEVGEYKHVSLSVDKANFAYAFYKKNGFVDHSSTEDSVTMVWNREWYIY